MSNTQFYTAMRYIALCQAGEIPINAEKLRSTMRMTLALPKFANIPVPSLLPSPQPSAGQQQQQQGSSGGAPGGTYAITPEEHTKYHALFLQYDLNKDNYLESHEAAPIFAKSGLDNATLAAIWSMSDVDRDSRLSSKEFALAFHLIVCVGKKKLPLPPSLPPALISFLQNAPSVPMTTASLGPLSSPAKAPTQPQAAVPASPVMAFPSPLASSTFPSLSEPEPMNTNVSKATPRPASVSLMPTSGGGGGGGFLEDQIELENNVKSVTDVAKKSLASQERSVEASEKGSSGLKYLLQKLNAEKIALTSQLSSVEEDAAKASAKLNATVEEVKQLHSEVEELRAALAKKKESAGVFVSSEKAELEKRQLLSEISQLKEILDKDLQNHRAAALNVKEIATEQAAMNAAIDSHGEQAAQVHL